MKNVFNASNSVEAYMIRNLLEQHGLDARVAGEYLQGGMGELPASGFARVMVADIDYELASSIIKEWDLQQQPADNIQQNYQIPKSISGFIFGSIFGGMIVFWGLNSPITEDGIDYNDDGVFETKYIYHDDKLNRTEVDRNLDNKTDMLYGYDYYGILSYLKTDDDFDGVYETKYKFRHGILASRESDFNGDDLIDYTVGYKYGVIEEVKIFDPETGQLRKVKKFTRGKLFASKFDSDGDGILDINDQYDFFEEVKSNNRK